MNVLVFFALFFGAMFLIPWLVTKFGSTNEGPKETTPNRRPAIKPKRGRRKTKPQYRSLPPEEQFPYWNPLHDDEDGWRTEIEPKYRKHPGNPPDWERRRILVFFRDKGKCQKCRRACGHNACEEHQVWNFKFDEHLLYNADVHHVKHRSVGGDHGLDNLHLYCLRCHYSEHPNNSAIRARMDVMGLGGGGSKEILPIKAPRTKEQMPF